HRPAELMKPRPRGLVALHAEHALDGERVRAVLVPRDLPDGDEPKLEWLAGALEDRPCRDRSLGTTLGAEKQAALHAPCFARVRALRADESLRPPQALQVAQAGGLIGEEPIEVRQVRRVVFSRSEAR